MSVRAFSFFYTFQMKSPKTQELHTELLMFMLLYHCLVNIVLILQQWMKYCPRLVCEIYELNWQQNIDQQKMYVV